MSGVELCSFWHPLGSGSESPWELSHQAFRSPRTSSLPYLSNKCKGLARHGAASGTRPRLRFTHQLYPLGLGPEPWVLFQALHRCLSSAVPSPWNVLLFVSLWQSAAGPWAHSHVTSSVKSSLMLHTWSTSLLVSTWELVLLRCGVQNHLSIFF